MFLWPGLGREFHKLAFLKINMYDTSHTASFQRRTSFLSLLSSAPNPTPPTHQTKPNPPPPPPFPAPTPQPLYLPMAGGGGGVGAGSSSGGSGSGGGGREGDWDCGGCGNRNYAFRSLCNRCKQPRLLVDPNTPRDSKWLPRAGDWICTGIHTALLPRPVFPSLYSFVYSAAFVPAPALDVDADVDFRSTHA